MKRALAISVCVLAGAARQSIDSARRIDERYAGYVQLVPLAQAAER
ncbi:MAG: hypothetical protein ACJ79H_16985 [Myxococcales bacterium]